MSEYKVYGTKENGRDKLIIEKPGSNFGYLKVWDTGSTINYINVRGEEYTVYKHKIAVRYNGKIRYFYVNGSASEFENGISKYNPSYLTEALLFLIEDALLAARNKDVDEYAEELGITKPSVAIEMYKYSKRILNRFLSLGLTEDMLFELDGVLSDAVDKDIDIVEVV